MAKSKTKKKTSESHLWVQGRAEMDRMFGDLAERRRQWMVLALSSMALSTALVIGMVVLATSDRNIPWIVEVDRLGEVRFYGELGSQPVPEHAKIAVLHKAVHYMREIPGDIRIMQGRHEELNAILVGQALAAFSTDIPENVEELRALLGAGARRYVESVTSVLPFPAQPGLYRVTWDEGMRGSGAPKETFEGHFQIITGPPPEAEGAVIYNPLGIYIAAYSVTPIKPSP